MQMSKLNSCREFNLKIKQQQQQRWKREIEANEALNSLLGSVVRLLGRRALEGIRFQISQFSFLMKILFA